MKLGEEDKQVSFSKLENSADDVASSTLKEPPMREEKSPSHPPAPTSKFGSLDFERIINTYSIQATRNRLKSRRKSGRPSAGDYSLLGSDDDAKQEEATSYGSFPRHRSSEFHPAKPKASYIGRTASRWMLVCVTGLLTGLTAILIVVATETIIGYRSNLLDRFAYRIPTGSLFGGYLLYNLVLALISSVLCLVRAPEAIGSGIPGVKAYLNGVRVKRFTMKRLFPAKIVATILSVSSGLAVGPEGPLIHVGAMIGGTLTKLGPNIQSWLGEEKSSRYRWLSKMLLDLSHFCTDGERRDMISIGAAAGFASAFGAPIGGLLFSLEEASSFFDHSMLFKTLTATAIATFCLAVFRGNLSDFSVISLGNLDTPDGAILIRFAEIPLYVLVGACGGLLGALFCYVWKSMNEFRHFIRVKLGRRPHVAYQILEVVIVSVATSTMTFWLPFASWACRSHGVTHDIVDDDNPLNLSPQHRFNCEPGQVNEVGSIFFGSRENSIKEILTDPTQFDPRTLLLTGLLFFPLMTITLGVSLPSGIFMPTVLIGSCLGGFVGVSFQAYLSHEVSPAIFALLGAAALLAGVQRSTVSLCVILVEGTGQTKLLIPVICTVVVARYVGNLFTDDLYTIAMEISGYPYLEHHVNKFYDTLKASDIMSGPPVTLKAVERAETIARALIDNTHHGFPVVGRSGKFLGLVRRDQLVALLECGVFLDDDNSSVPAALRSPSHEIDEAGGESVLESPLLEQAYNVSDDRYHEILLELTPEKRANLEDDNFDQHAWLVDTIHRHSKADITHIEESLPQMNDGSSSSTFVTKDVNGRLIVKLDIRQRNELVDIHAAMNRGTYCCTETCPLSKLYEMFTSLGLRHVVVLGGESGGEIVGMVTRYNLMPDFVEERTRLAERDARASKKLF